MHSSCAPETLSTALEALGLLSTCGLGLLKLRWYLWFMTVGWWSWGRQKVTTSIATSGLPWWVRRQGIACNAGDPDWIPGLGRSPGGGHGNPLHYSHLENPHGQRSLAGYSPRGRKEPDTTERLSPAQHIAPESLTT